MNRAEPPKRLHAIVLAGGLGSRMEPWRAPKCLLPLTGVPLLHRILKHLSTFRCIRKVTVCTGYRAEDIKASLRWGGFGWAVTSFLPQDAGMCARIQKAARRERVLVCYGDELADVDVEKLYRKHLSDEADITFTDYWVRVPYGVRGRKMFPEQSVIRVQELPMNIGFVIMEPHALRKAKPADGLATFISNYAEGANNKVRHFTHEGKRVTVNSIPEWQQAEETWK